MRDRPILRFPGAWRGAGSRPLPADVTLLQKEGHVQASQKPLGQGQDEGEVSAALSRAQK